MRKSLNPEYISPLFSPPLAGVDEGEVDFLSSSSSQGFDPSQVVKFNPFI
jgi:hypothetical protein